MGLSEQYAADLRQMMEDRPTEFSYSGGNFTGIRSKLSEEFARGDYGYTTGARYTLRAFCEDLPQTPKPEELIAIGGESFRIKSPVEVDSFGVSVLLNLVPESA